MDAVVTDTMTDQQNAEIERTVRTESGRLFNFIRKRVRHDDAAQDILQDVFWQLIEAYRRLQTIERVTSWLFQVARNKIADSFRNTKPQPSFRTEAEREEGMELNLEDFLPDLSENPEESYIRDVIWNEIEIAVEELPQPLRDVFIWHEFEGMRHRASFYVDTDMLVEAQEGTSVSRHCPVCRKTTNWAFVCLERRSGRDRRQDSNRRTHTS